MNATTSLKRALIFLGLAWAVGCGGSGLKVQPTQLLAQPEGQKAASQAQTQLLLQASRASLADFRDYQVGPEDLLEVQVYNQDKLNRQVRVNGQGQISLPLVGDVQVGGLSPQEIEKRLVTAYGSQFLRHPQVSVAVKEYRHQRVSVTGAVDKPGYYEMIGPRSLLEMLAMAGGLQDRPGGVKAGDMVHVIRSQSAAHLSRALKSENPRPFSSQAETIVIDLRKLLKEGKAELNLPIRHGDVIHVPFAGNAYVLGGVYRPGSVAVKENLTLSQAVAMAGGPNPVLANNKVDILRLNEGGQPVLISTHLDKVLARQEEDPSLKDNDVVVVGQSSLKKALFVFKELLPGAISGAYRFAP